MYINQKRQFFARSQLREATMYTFSIQTSIKKGKRVELKNLPFAEGEQVEVVLVRLPKPSSTKRYPLRGQGIRYDAPTEPVAVRDWDATS